MQHNTRYARKQETYMYTQKSVTNIITPTLDADD